MQGRRKKVSIIEVFQLLLWFLVFIRNKAGMSSKYHRDLYNKQNQIRLDEDTKGTA